MFGHPRGRELGAWFDGEGADKVGGHVVRCSSCQRRVSELARVRAWVRAQPFFAMSEETGIAAPPQRRWKPAAVLAVVGLVSMLLFADGKHDAMGTRTVLDRLAGDRDGLLATTPEIAAGDPTDRVPVAEELPEAAPLEPPAQDVAPAPAAPPGVQPPPSNAPLRLGLVVPTTGRLASEGTEVTEVVKRRVDAANVAGGVAGFPVELVVVAAEDTAALASLPRLGVMALVGGFGTAPPPDVPWLFPADPTLAAGNVVAAEAPARAVGAQLASWLRGQGLDGTVGVVVGSGPDTALAAGLASRAATTVTTARPDTSCGAEVAALQRAGAVAVAVAGDPDLAARCLRALSRSAWRPRLGALVAPSAAYARLHTAPEAWGARTVLALPWPTSPAPGAARFRAIAQSTSYRALVSFAATELAIDVARQRSAVSLASLSAGTWRSDLFDLTGTAARGVVVVAGPDIWLPATDSVVRDALVPSWHAPPQAVPR